MTTAAIDAHPRNWSENVLVTPENDVYFHAASHNEYRFTLLDRLWLPRSLQFMAICRSGPLFTLVGTLKLYIAPSNSVKIALTNNALHKLLGNALRRNCAYEQCRRPWPQKTNFAAFPGVGMRVKTTGLDATLRRLSWAGV